MDAPRTLRPQGRGSRRDVVDDPGAGTPDHIVAKYASLHVLTVVTWNVRHFQRLMRRRTKAGELAFPNMGLIGFECREISGEIRLRAYIELIEHEYEHVQRLADKRLHVLVGFHWLRVFR